MICNLHDEAISYADIAERVGVTKGVVAGVLWRAQKRLDPAERTRRRVENRLKKVSPAKKRKPKAMRRADPTLPPGIFTKGRREPIGCRYVHGDVARGMWGYCQAPRVEDSPYCPEHHAACYRPYQGRGADK